MGEELCQLPAGSARGSMSSPAPAWLSAAAGEADWALAGEMGLAF